MLLYAAMFLGIAIIAAIFGFTDIVMTGRDVADVIVVVFFALACIALLSGRGK